MTKRKLRVHKKGPATRADTQLTFAEHLHELRRALVFVVGSILLFSGLAYLVQQKIVAFLLAPSQGQQFIYTSPVGGINFLFSICVYAGIIISLPVIIYQIMRFIKPLFGPRANKSVWRYCFFSAVLAVAGFCAGYYIGLPIALHFLSHQFTNHQVHALLTLQEYMSFLTFYLLGSALLFQLPIILLIINRIKPLKPSGLLKTERYVIVGAFIVSMLMAPTPDVFNQLIIAVPIIIMYNVGIILVAITGRKTRLAKSPPQAVEAKPEVIANTEQVLSPELPQISTPLAQNTVPLVGLGGLSPQKFDTKRIIMDIFPSPSSPLHYRSLEN